MKILLLTTSFPLSLAASSGVFVERLAQQLAWRCQLHVLAPAGVKPFSLMDGKKYRLSTFRYATANWQVLAHGGGGIPATLAARPWLRILVPLFVISMMIHCFWHARRADIIFANWSVCGVVAGVVGRLLGLPVVATVRGEDVNRADTSFTHRILIGLCLRLCQRVVTVSDDLARRIKEQFPAMAGRVVMIPNGVSVNINSHQSRRDEKSTEVRLLMVGSLIPRKSVKTALYALAQLPERYSLTVLGDGPELDMLKALIVDCSLGARVNIVGHVPPEDVSHWLLDSDILIMASRSEGRPNAVLEAMAAGLPVVGSDIPGVQELVIPGVSGFLFPVDDVPALVTCLLSLSDVDMRHKLGDGGRHLILERGLTWENTASHYLNQFEKLLLERG